MSTYQENTAPDESMVGLPLGLQEYYAMYPDGSGDLLFLGMGISTIYRNAMPPNAPNMTMTISDVYGFGTGNLAAGKMREALFGTLSPVPSSEIEACESAYLKAHPDARGWVPPNGPHSSYYARFTIEKVFAFHGFGNVAYIGWIDLPLWKKAGEQMRGEKEVKKHWPVPEQPEQGDLSVWGGGERLRIQL